MKEKGGEVKLVRQSPGQREERLFEGRVEERGAEQRGKKGG